MKSSSFRKLIVKFLNLKYSKAINISTFAGIPWKSDKLSQFKKRDGKFDISVLNENWQDFYFKKDLIILRFLYSKYRALGYKIKKLNIIEKLFLPFFFLLPMKFELQMIKSILFTNSKNKVLFNLYFYLRKICYFYKTYFIR